MSGGLPFWIIVLLCWSRSVQLTTCTSSLMPVFASYFFANAFQNAAVLSLEYSAATILIDFTGVAVPPEPDPVPPLQAVSASAKAAAAATNPVARFLTRSSYVLVGVGRVEGATLLLEVSYLCPVL